MELLTTNIQYSKYFFMILQPVLSRTRKLYFWVCADFFWPAINFSSGSKFDIKGGRVAILAEFRVYT